MTVRHISVWQTDSGWVFETYKMIAESSGEFDPVYEIIDTGPVPLTWIVRDEFDLDNPL